MQSNEARNNVFPSPRMQHGAMEFFLHGSVSHIGVMTSKDVNLQV